MSARERILGRLERQLSDQPGDRAAAVAARLGAKAQTAPRPTQSRPERRVEQFIAKAQAADATVSRIASMADLPAALFWDIECGAWYEEAANWLGHDPDGTPGPAEPLAAGFTDGSFKGLSPITRAQDARMLFRLFGEPSPGGYTHSFTDVPPWVTAAVNWVNWPGGPASPEPLMTGFGSEFRPDDNITRAAKARQLFRAAGSPVAGVDFTCTSHGFTDVPAWVEDAVVWLTCPDEGPGGVTPIATGYPEDNTFRPYNDITRAANGRMLQRFDEAGHTL